MKCKLCSKCEGTAFRIISFKPIKFWPCDQCDGEGLEPASRARELRAPNIISNWKAPNVKDIRKQKQIDKTSFS